jgi:glutathione S-transferase
MSDKYRIFGGGISPYSVKVRSYFRYKGIPHEWIVRDTNTMAEYKKYAKLPIVPLVVTPEDEGMQDSTPIIETIEARVPEPTIHPDDGTLRFLSELIEEFGDEWGNKWIFHYRWARDADQRSATERIVAGGFPDASDEERQKLAEDIRERMSGRGWVVGSNEKTVPLIEDSFEDSIQLIEQHLANRSYLFGERPSLADFGLAAQIYQASTDPTAGAILSSGHDAICRWIDRMLDPKAEGEFETWSSLQPTLAPIFKIQVRPFLLWSAANAAALASGAEEFTVDLDGRSWSQTVGGPQKYHAKSLREIRRKYSEQSSNPELRGILETAGCLESLA